MPPWFEDAVSAAARINLKSPKALAEIAPVVEHLAKRFMRQEDSLPKNYFSDAETRRAYISYFFATNVMKIHPVLNELERAEFFVNRDRVRVLDIGTGVGTASIGLWMWMARQRSPAALHIVATDESPEVCEEAARTVQTFRKHIDTPSLEFEKQPVPLDSLAAAGLGTFDVIMAQNVLIESPEYQALIEFAQGALRDDGALILIEPASRFGSRALLQCRDALVSAGLTIYAPCLMQGACPALVKDSDWCHTVARWDRPKFVKIIDEQIGNLRLSLKFSYVIAMKKKLNIAATFPHVRADALYRVGSDRIDEKGRKKLYGCGTAGRFFFEKQKRDTTDANAAFDESHRYDILEIEGFVPKATFQRLNPDGTVNMVERFEKKTEL